MLIVTFVTGGFTGANLYRLGGLTVSSVASGEYYRIITAAFLHGDFLHFLSNMVIGLIVLGSGLERIIGSKKFTFIYVVSLIVSGITVYFFNDLTNSLSITIGASGAIFGVLGSLLFITVYRKEMLLERDLQSVKMLALVQVVFTFLNSNVSIPGHIGGLAIGFLLGFLVIKTNRNSYDKQTDTYDFTVH